METLGLSHSTPKSRPWILDLFWPRLTNEIEADTALRNGMYVCFACALATVVLIAVTAGGKANLIGAVLVGIYLIFLGAGIRAGSRVAAVTAFAYYTLNLLIGLSASSFLSSALIIQIIAIALFLGSVRAAFYLKAEMRRNAESEVPPELPETAFYGSAPPELVALARRDRGLEERIKKVWKTTSPMPQILVGLSWCFILIGILFTTVMRLYVSPTGSMEPTLQVGDQVIALNYPFAGPMRRGDTVVFRAPYNINMTMEKRVVGLPGDHIQVRGDHLILNGKLVREPYVKTPSDFPPVDFPTQTRRTILVPGAEELQVQMYSRDIHNSEYVVPPNSYFVLGDNRGNSLDSRYFGAVPRPLISGRLIHVYGNTSGNFNGKPHLLRFPLGAS